MRLPVAGALAALMLSAVPVGAQPTTWASTAIPLGPVQQNSHVTVGLGRDNGQSAGLKGRSYWLFGDTLESTDGPGVQFVDNTGAMTTDLDGSDGIRLTSSNLWTEDPAGVPQPIVTLRPQEKAFEARHSTAKGCTAAKDPYCGTTFAIWPGSVVADPARGRVLVFYNKLCRGGATQCTSGFAGTGLGIGIAAVDPARRTVTRLRATNADVPSPEGIDPTLLFGLEGGSGSAFIHGSYLYALVDCTGVEFRCRLGRVPAAAVMDRFRWEFYVGERRGKAVWDADLRRGTRPARSGAAGGTIQWVPGMRAFLNVYMLPLSNDLVFQTAPQPWGPWTAPTTMLTTAQGGTGPNYAGFAHPEYATDKGLTQYVTYYMSGSGITGLVKVRFCPATGAATVCT